MISKHARGLLSETELGSFQQDAEIFEDSFQNSERETQAQGDVPKLEISLHGNQDRCGCRVTECPT